MVPPQAMQPHGVVGRVFGWLMERLNQHAYAAALRRLDPQPGASIVEIGFGTGRFVELVAARVPDGLVAGVDPSPLMVDKARRRNVSRIAAKRVDLRVGTAAHLPWSDETFDAAVALHSFQFWADPAANLREVQRVVRRGGLLLLVLRSHGQSAPEWLPNALSRSGAEVEQTVRLLEQLGFSRVSHEGRSRSSAIVTAECARSFTPSGIAR